MQYSLAMLTALVARKKSVPQEYPLKRTALILSGGGARAAYQVGVLKAIAEILPKEVHNPFGILCGTSAGALNATAIAAHASRFRAGVLGLEAVWRSITAEQVYRTEMRALSQNALQWMGTLFLGRRPKPGPTSLLDNSPLRDLIGRTIHFPRIQKGIDAGDLHALSITCSGYNSGHSVSFYQGHPSIQPWRRARRVGSPTNLTPEHLLASAAIPTVFPAVKLGPEFYGDGSVRQLAPISPALHLGADRVLVIGVSASGEVAAPLPPSGEATYPTVAQILGHVLDSAFLDSLEGDFERLMRINRTLDLIPEEERAKSGLRQVEVLQIRPSESLDAIAAYHAHELPRAVRLFLRGSGATQRSGSTLVSYLLFEQGFCRDLIRLGYHDAMNMESQILHFLGHDAHEPADAPAPHSDVC